MSTSVAATASSRPVSNGERWHRVRLIGGYLLAIGLILGLGAWGFHYYALPVTERPHSEAHRMLRPSGAIGLKLGFLGLAMFATIFLYPLRRRWGWLSRQGSSRHWLDFHVLLGTTAPFVIALHASFKFRGLAGMAFYIMVAVALSGVLGRYLYAQIPRRLAAAEVSRREVKEQLERTAALLDEQRLLPRRQLATMLAVPDPDHVRRLSAVGAIARMLALDLRRAWGTASLRRQAVPLSEWLGMLGGLLPTSRADLEAAIGAARREAAAAKQVVFLARAQQLFRLWHVVHRPFSYSFVLLVLIHLAVVAAMGYF